MSDPADEISVKVWVRDGREAYTKASALRIPFGHKATLQLKPLGLDRK
ncbi:MAG: hypothetical protein ACRC1Z_00215 [Waterburya sp.]